jgi:alpha-D-xyloside xylohydrolase
LHGSDSYRVPWLVDDESVDVLRRFARLKNRLMPYLYRAAVTAHENGTPVLRAMMLSFPDDPAAHIWTGSTCSGRTCWSRRCCPADGVVDYYVPAGRWVSLLTGEAVDGPGWRRETHGYDSLPLLVRPGAVLPVGSHDDRPDYDYLDGLTLLTNRPAAGTAVSVPDLTGATAGTFTVADGRPHRRDRAADGGRPSSPRMSFPEPVSPPPILELWLPSCASCPYLCQPQLQDRRRGTRSA